ncbi:hypothetical protein BXP70_21605 [Hymenobacter crusticola]|uniref:Uncharacterized protein n=1 Tax=Hymenobacter crusticola TaxID=1770526 RepID=A0A243W8M2_9BACT|nr:hypothetical protein BXP70_21605 [Hymenobacter crusticola]
MRGYKRLKARHDGANFLIEEDKPDVGAYLYVFRGSTVWDDLQNSILDCQEIALEDFGVPLDAWRPIKSIFV